MIDIINEESAGIEKEIVVKRRSYGGSLFEGRFKLYDKVKFPIKVLDIIIISSVVLLFVVFILGAYIK